MTLRIGIAGIDGRMGREIAALAAQDRDIAIVGGISRSPANDSWPIFTNPANFVREIDVLIDFTSPEGAVEHARACAADGVPFVTGTTGLSREQSDALRAAAAVTAVFQAANMSPGVNALLAVLPLLSRALADYDVEIVETHHRHKVDAPSGTALALASAITAGSGDLASRANFGRRGDSPRAAGEIGIHAVRGGGNPGEHVVILAGDGEEVRLSHRAFGRAAYAQGALRAAKLIVDRPAGWYEPATLPGFL
jgi:4-hydroxy-tetrahydrodipicolinate reductase